MANNTLTFPAHIRIEESGGPDIVQTVAEHCRNTAKIAKNLAGTELSSLAYLAALLHDFGKYTIMFKTYIEKAARNEPVDRGSVNHTFAGVHFVMERWHNSDCQSMENLTAELLAIAIGGHHGQFDCFDETGKDGFLYRTTKENELYLESKKHFLDHCAGLEELDSLFSKAVDEVNNISRKIHSNCKSASQMDFWLGLLARHLLSLIIEGDRRDTAEFSQGKALYNTAVFNESMWRRELDFTEKKILSMPADTEINKSRRSISDLCREAANLTSGIYSLDVPTGGGKTLASLRYALAAAAAQNKKRVLFVIPLLSVLEQNAKVIRKFVSPEMSVLEHHSNIVNSEDNPEQLENWQLLTETWDSPLIVTTLVQLLNTLFSGKTSCIRRMNSLSDSIIVIDEVQSVPSKMLSLFTEAINLLACSFNATVILCSATQPGWEHMAHPVIFNKPKDIVPYSDELWSVFKRTEIIEKKEPLDFDSLTSFGLDCMHDRNSLLLICNTKSEALTLYNKIKVSTDATVFHLSTGMCMAHRIETLNAINKALKNKERIVCVATQLVEAGVDFSFSCVIRIAAGMENIIQAAGRCNRNGESPQPCPVYIVKLIGEKLGNLPDISRAKEATLFVLNDYSKNPESFDNDLSSGKTINHYYQTLYTELSAGAQDYPLNGGYTLFSMLSTNNSFWGKCSSRPQAYLMRQAFKTAGSHFKVFEDNTTDVLVPYGKGCEIIADLNSAKAKYNLEYCKAKLEEAKAFSVSLYDNNIIALEKEGGLTSLWEGKILVLKPEFYSELTGFSKEGNNYNYMEV